MAAADTEDLRVMQEFTAEYLKNVIRFWSIR